MLQPTKIGLLTPTAFIEKRGRRTFWLWRCECGNEKVLRSDNGARSCGCLRLGKNTTHGMYGTRVYRIWATMLQRVLNKKCDSFERYGGRGITVNKRWRKFENFFADMGNPPSDKHSIERKNNDGPYTKSNCKWATNAEQMRNTSRSLFLTIGGRTQVLKDWSLETGIPFKTLQERLHRGWTPEEIIGTSPRPSDRYLTLNGISLTVNDWAERLGEKAGTINSRLRFGWSVAQALNGETPPTRKGKTGMEFTINGETRFLGDWAHRQGLPVHRVWQRITILGWPPKKALEME